MKITIEEYTRLIQAETKLNLLLDTFQKCDEYEFCRIIKAVKRSSLDSAAGTQSAKEPADAE